MRTLVNLKGLVCNGHGNTCNVNLHLNSVELFLFSLTIANAHLKVVGHTLSEDRSSVQNSPFYVVVVAIARHSVGLNKT